MKLSKTNCLQQGGEMTNEPACVLKLQQESELAGVEYMQLKENKDGVFFRSSWDTQPIDEEWIKSKYTTLEETRNHLGEKYRTPQEWGIIHKIQKQQNDINRPLINRIGEVDKEIKILERKMSGMGVINLTVDDQERYWNLLDKQKNLHTMLK